MTSSNPRTTASDLVASAPSLADDFGLGPIDQVAFVVRDMDAALPIYTAMFGRFNVRSVRYDPEQTTSRGIPVDAELVVATCRSGGIEVELIQVVRGNAPQAEHLTAHGEGIHHVRFIVENLDATLALMEPAGFERVLFGHTPSGSYRAYVTCPERFGFTQVEVLERPDT